MSSIATRRSDARDLVLGDDLLQSHESFSLTESFTDLELAVVLDGLWHHVVHEIFEGLAAQRARVGRPGLTHLVPHYPKHLIDFSLRGSDVSAD